LQETVEFLKQAEDAKEYDINRLKVKIVHFYFIRITEPGSESVMRKVYCPIFVAPRPPLSSTY